jgi:hypothetical protein
MDRRATATFKGYDIFTFAIPTGDGKWAATGEIQKISDDGQLEIEQHFSGPVLAATEPDARAEACHAAERKILELIADPVMHYH